MEAVKGRLRDKTSRMVSKEVAVGLYASLAVTVSSIDESFKA